MKFARSSLQTLPATAYHAARSILIHFRNASRTRKIVLITGLCIVVTTTVWLTVDRPHSPAETETSSSMPEFQTVLPPRTSIEELGGWQRVSPSDVSPTFAYTDTIEDVRVTVSQQLLPANFMENTEQRVKDLAEGFSATTELPLEGSDRLYIGTSARGPQSAIIIKNGLLILIKSEEKISDAAWKQYAASLE